MTNPVRAARLLKNIAPLAKKYGMSGHAYVNDAFVKADELGYGHSYTDDEKREVLDYASGRARIRGESEEFISDMEAFFRRTMFI